MKSLFRQDAPGKARQRGQAPARTRRAMWRDRFDPAWFTPSNLAAEWLRHGARTRAIRTITVAIVLLLCCAPQTMALAAYIDTLGIDAFLGLMELQFVVGFALLTRALRPCLGRWARRFGRAAMHRWHVITWCVTCWLDSIRSGRLTRPR